MLTYSYENLKKAIDTEVGKKFVEYTKNIYDEYFKDKPITSLKYSHFLLVYKNGNRDLYETSANMQRRRLAVMQILALSDDGYIDELEDSINAILEEYTWVLPAHNLQKDNSFDYSVIDLYSAETAFYLSEIAFVFGDKLSLDIRNRIRYEIKRRVIDNYESRKHLWDNIINNWAAVCAGSVGMAYIYAFPERFDMVKHRIFNSLECYLKGMNSEGTTPEGVNYWVYGFGYFARFFDLYYQYTEEFPEILQSEKVVNTLKYIDNACLGGKCYLPFADGGAKETFIYPGVAYACKNLFGDNYVLPEYVLDQEYVYKILMKNNKASVLRIIYGMAKYGMGDKKEVKQGTFYYGQSQIFIHKNQGYSFTAKCGHNLEMHNHNDVGSFQIVVDGKGVIVDSGPGKYTWEYFNDDNYRYSEKAFAAGSMGHSVPIVNGKYQNTGVKYCGKVLEQTDKNFKLDLAKAYDGGVENLTVDYQMLTNGVKVVYDCKGIESSITFRFLSFNEPRLNSDGSVDVGIIVKSLSKLNVKIGSVKTGEHDAQTVYTLDYTVEDCKDLIQEFTFTL